MAFAARSVPALSEPEEGTCSSSEEELLGPRAGARCLQPRARTAGLLAALLAACALLAAAGLHARGSAAEGAGAAPAAAAAFAAKPVSVRQLLEGSELTDVVTDNFMSLGHGHVNPAQRGEVRAAVTDNLLNISGSIRARHPEDHAKLGLIELSQEQKDSVLRLLRYYSDPRVLRLGDDIADATAETQAGDGQSLKHRLAAKLQPRLRELRGLCDEIAPGSGKDLHLDAEDFDEFEPAQTFGKWSVHVEMSAPTAAHRGRLTGLLAPRRLSPTDTLGGTRDQATTALQHLGGMLGKTMPAAPARMLLFDKQKELEQQTTGYERFAKCVMDNMSSPPDMLKCLMTNCRRAMNWIMSKLHLGDMMAKMSHA